MIAAEAFPEKLKKTPKIIHEKNNIFLKFINLNNINLYTLIIF